MNVTVNQNYSWGKPVGAEYHTGPRRPNETPVTFALDNIFGAVLKAEEKASKVDQILPFPLELTNENIANIFAMVLRLKCDLNRAKHYGIISKSKRDKLGELVDKTKKIESMLSEIKTELGKMKL